MSETADWKQKYRESLAEMETQEIRWRQVEQALRRLVLRLCAAGMGVNPRLDDELIKLAAANRRNADADELTRLAESLTTAVVAVMFPEARMARFSPTVISPLMVMSPSLKNVGSPAI